MVGRSVSVYWGCDHTWYKAKVMRYKMCEGRAEGAKGGSRLRRRHLYLVAYEVRCIPSLGNV